MSLLRASLGDGNELINICWSELRDGFQIYWYPP